MIDGQLKLGKMYKNSNYKQFPQYIVLTKKREPSEHIGRKITYLFCDVQTGHDKGYLTEDEIKIVYVEIE